MLPISLVCPPGRRMSQSDCLEVPSLRRSLPRIVTVTKRPKGSEKLLTVERTPMRSRNVLVLISHSRPKLHCVGEVCNDWPYWKILRLSKRGPIILCESFECLKDESDNNVK